MSCGAAIETEEELKLPSIPPVEGIGLPSHLIPLRMISFCNFSLSDMAVLGLVS
jgi:hypothetical protein